MSDRRRIYAELGLALGLFLQHTTPFLVLLVLQYARMRIVPAIVLCWAAASVLTVWGCWHLMRNKGWHGAWGLFGLFGLLGIVVLASLPDAERSGAEPRAFEVLPAARRAPGAEAGDR